MKRDELLTLILGLAVAGLILATAPGCSTLPKHTRGEFQQYVERFQYEQRLHSRNGETLDKQVWPTINYGEVRYVPSLNSIEAAEYLPASWIAPAEIVVSKAIWEQLTSPQRELLIFHELGHAMGMKHQTAGIMRPVLMSAAEYGSNRSEYLDEFFNPSTIQARGAFEHLTNIK